MSETMERPACALPDTPLADAIPGIMTCVHCGFCLQACPTYRVLGDENDSPRGRILLMRSLVEGELDVEDPAVHTHISRCLGCRACETACPSGVPYGQLLEATRATLDEVRRPPFVARAILALFARPALLGVALAFARLFRATRLPLLFARVGGRIGFANAMLASTVRSVRRARRYTPQGTGQHGRVAILRGCVMEGLFAETNRATERTLVVNDYAVTRAPGQRCCGALHAHAGDLEGARALARTNIAAFERAGIDYIAVNASGCGAAMKEYGHLLRDDPAWAERAAEFSAKVRDVSELLAAAGPTPGAALPLTVTYDAPCHLLHAQRIARPPLAVLSSIPELTLVPLTDAEQCCGSAGIYNLLEPALSRAVLAPKLAHIAETGASLVATGNPGCLMHIGAGLVMARSRTRTVHPVDLLDAAYAERAP
ncbi:MAG TPA: heterodisulfide reductase-related iron-sulfur binding cluster [Gemmatimonadaceae bacterium]|jgi:glycolate oxidase iron-sulfur subunit|nr:heterodisulfide reductase-related iron-sulfur binding cluster [Gemmatimonadaceae bacterium]